MIKLSSSSLRERRLAWKRLTSPWKPHSCWFYEYLCEINATYIDFKGPIHVVLALRHQLKFLFDHEAVIADLHLDDVLLNDKFRESALELVEHGVCLLVLQEKVFEVKDTLLHELQLAEGLLYLLTVSGCTLVHVFHQLCDVLPDLHLQCEIAELRVLRYKFLALLSYASQEAAPSD